MNTINAIQYNEFHLFAPNCNLPQCAPIPTRTKVAETAIRARVKLTNFGGSQSSFISPKIPSLLPGPFQTFQKYILHCSSVSSYISRGLRFAKSYPVWCSICVCFRPRRCFSSEALVEAKRQRVGREVKSPMGKLAPHGGLLQFPSYNDTK